MSKSKEWFRQGASLSQQLGAHVEIYQQLAGADPETSESIAFFLTLGDLGYINLEEQGMKLMMGMLNARRQALFATSPHVNEITKMGFQLPKVDAEYYDE